ncbi:hypothetical protein [Legionella moravica]|uniref:hypothetical protein n=1 Tax=Legionella moravica TaxID=39962 RepID=UPI001F5FEC5A|nr:hypothetical protein [Legionella moravica]
MDYYEIHVDVYEAITRENVSRSGTVNGKLISLSKTILSGLTLASVYFDGWLPACAGMTGFFVMYRDKNNIQEAKSLGIDDRSLTTNFSGMDTNHIELYNPNHLNTLR